MGRMPEITMSGQGGGTPPAAAVSDDGAPCVCTDGLLEVALWCAPSTVGGSLLIPTSTHEKDCYRPSLQTRKPRPGAST